MNKLKMLHLKQLLWLLPFVVVMSPWMALDWIFVCCGQNR